MKTKTLKLFLLIFATCGFLVISCKKDNTTSTVFTSAQISQVQNSDAQDAIADKNDQDVDNTLDQLQVTNYQPSATKSDMTMPGRTITVCPASLRGWRRPAVTGINSLPGRRGTAAA